MPDALALACRALGVRVCNGMGMTETGPTAFLVDPADAWERIGSVGKPQLLCSRADRRRRGPRSADGEVGDLQFAGPGVTPGYWGNEEATRAAFTERRLADLGRPRPARRRRLLLDRRAAQGDVHLGRRERLSGRGRERALGPSGDRRCGGARRGGPEMGRGRPRLRPARAGRGRARAEPSSRPSAAPASPPTRCRAASTSSPNSRAPRPARSRSICSSEPAETKCGGLETNGTHEPAATGSDQKHPAKLCLARQWFIGAWRRAADFTVSGRMQRAARLAIRRIISSGERPALSRAR